MTDLIKSTEELRAAFSEGIITAMPRDRVEKLVKIVKCLITEKPVMCVRLSSSFPNRIAVTQSEKYSINHYLLPIENFKKISEGEGFSKAHRIMPRCDFDPDKIIKTQRQEYTLALRYVNTLFPDENPAELYQGSKPVKQIRP